MASSVAWQIALSGLAAIGFVISSYFTAVAFRWIRPDENWIPAFCRMEDRTCASIVFAPQARVFGPPNSLLGQIYYLALLVGLVAGWVDEPRVLGLSVLASLVTVGLAAYLSYQLLYVTRVPCPLCFSAHGINVLIFALLLGQVVS